MSDRMTLALIHASKLLPLSAPAQQPDVVIRIKASWAPKYLMRIRPQTLFVCAGTRLLARGGCVVEVDANTFLLIVALASRPGAFVSRDYLIELLFGHRADGGPDNAIDVFEANMMTMRPALMALGFRCDRVRGFGVRVEALTLNEGEL